MTEQTYDTEKMTPHAKKAFELFCRGYNCAQSAFCAFCDIMGMDEKQALRISSSFGGGMGRMREVCGACSGIFMAAGVLYGYDTPSDEDKCIHYTRIQELARCFRARFGTIICRELLSRDGVKTDETPVPTPRDAAFAHNRRCYLYVAEAAAVLDEYIGANPPEPRSI